LGLTIGLLMAAGSFCYVLSLQKLPVGTAATFASCYVVLVILLSCIFLHESMSVLKLVGIAFTLIGVVILSLQQ
jgi:drug/metabolite transporter (DMT)-like permease